MSAVSQPEVARQEHADPWRVIRGIFWGSMAVLLIAAYVLAGFAGAVALW